MTVIIISTENDTLFITAEGTLDRIELFDDGSENGITLGLDEETLDVLWQEWRDKLDQH